MVEAMNEVTAPVGMTYGQQLMQEGLQLLADGKRAEAAQVLARARSERDTLLQAHALIEANDLVGSFRNIMGLDCTISSSRTTSLDFLRATIQHQSAARLPGRRLAHACRS
jgi:hypothetical protein